MTDTKLLRRFTAERCNEAFTSLVERHLDMVYSVALRQVRSPELAEDVTQAVFTTLAFKANSLRPDSILPAWLYRVTRYTAADLLRKEMRHHEREQRAMELNDSAEPAWAHVEPHLDTALDELPDRDRSLVLLRFFQNQSLRDIGAALGISEDAARKRVSRALEDLRNLLTKRGVTVSGVALGALLSTNAVQAAPLGLGLAVSAVAKISAGAALHSTSIPVSKLIAMTAAQKVTIVIGTAVLATGFFEAHQFSSLRERTDVLNTKEVALAERVVQIDAGNHALTNALAVARTEISSLKQDSGELARLRGQVTRLREQSRELEKQGAQKDELAPELSSWAARVAALKETVEKMPHLAIPELALLSERDWLMAGRDARFETEEQLRESLKSLRNAAKNLLAKNMGTALRGYVGEHEGQLPGALSDLKPYFVPPIDDAVLGRYELLKGGKVSDIPANDSSVIGEKAPPLDNDYDTRHKIGLNGYSVSQVSDTARIIEQATREYSAANDGQMPKELSQLEPFIPDAANNPKLQGILNGRR